MANRIPGLLVGYKSRIDPTIWYRYEPMSDEELKAHQEYAVAKTSDDEDTQHARDLFLHVKEIWHRGELVASGDSEDVYDTLAGNGGALGMEAVGAMLRRAIVTDAEAPFLLPPSTGA